MNVSLHTSKQKLHWEGSWKPIWVQGLLLIGMESPKFPDFVTKKTAANP